MAAMQVHWGNTILEGLKQYCRNNGIVHSRRCKGELLVRALQAPMADSAWCCTL
jgi:prophage tail gpP-like protein